MRKFNKVDSQIEYADIKYIGQSNYTCGNHVYRMLQRMEMFHKGNRSQNNIIGNFRIK